MGRKVTLVRMHQSIHAGGKLGELGNCLPRPSKVIPGLAMEHTPEGVLVETPIQSFIIPWGNVIIALVEPKEVTPKAE